MIDKETTRGTLLKLAENYEAGNRHYIGFSEETEEERRYVAELKAEGSIVVTPLGLIQFTDKGYNNYKARIETERTFRTSP